MDLFDYVMQTPQNTNPAVLSSEISKAVEESQVQADYAQNDQNAKDYIKNRPFYGKNGTRLRNTYEDWAAAGGDDGSGAKPILSFIINDEIYENITPNVYNSGYTKVYNIPSVEQPKYQVVAYTQNRSIICTLRGSSKEIENWSIYPPEETEEIHYLDSKYLDPGLLARIEKLESGALTVHVTDNNGTLQASKSYIEIMDAILAGTTVLVDYGFYTLPIIAVADDALYFGTFMCDSGDDVNGAVVATSIIQITKNNEVLDLGTLVDIPSALPNPNALTFTGAVTGSYDGSEALTVEIPSGGGDGCNKPTIIFDSGEITEEVNIIGPIDISQYSRIRIFGKVYPSINSAGKRALQIYFQNLDKRILCNAGNGKLFDTSGNPVSFLIYLHTSANAISTYSYSGYNAEHIFDDADYAVSSMVSSPDGGSLVYSTKYDFTQMHLSAQNDLSTRPFGIGTRIMVIGDE